MIAPPARSTAGRPRSDPLILIFDADESFSSRCAEVFRGGGLETAVVNDREELLRHLTLDRPIAVVLGERLRGCSSTAVLHELVHQDARVPVVVILEESDVAAAVGALKVGAFDVLVKPVKEQRLFDAIWKALESARKTRKTVREAVGARSRLASLTEREVEILDHISKGCMSKQIAALLKISSKTVEAHRAKITAKMGADTLAGLVRLYFLATMWRDPFREYEAKDAPAK